MLLIRILGFLFAACTESLTITFVNRWLLWAVDALFFLASSLAEASCKRYILLADDNVVLDFFITHLYWSFLSLWRVQHIHLIFDFLFNCILFIIKYKDILGFVIFWNYNRLCCRIYPLWWASVSRILIHGLLFPCV